MASAREAADLVLGVVDATIGGAVAGADLVVWNQIDKPEALPTPRTAVPVSAATGAGLVGLASAVEEALTARASGIGRDLSARHLDALARAANQVAEVLDGLSAGLPLDVFAEGLRAATDALDGITGATTPEDVLDRIFAQFCLGK